MTAFRRGPKAARAVFIAAFLGVALVLVVGASANTYKNTSAIPIPDASLTIPPVASVTTSTIPVSETSTITSVSVSLIGIQHDNADDLDIALISPANTKVVLMSDAGTNPPAGGPVRIVPESPINPGTTLTFSDSGGVLPAQGTIPSGTYHPADYPASTDPFCQGETDQAGPYTTTLSSFANGQTANGTWTLNIRDDCGGGTGRISSGWCLIINNASGPCQLPTAVELASLRARVSPQGVRMSWRTGQESNIAGFNVYRIRAGKATRANRSLLRAKASGSTRGAGYSFTDRAATRPNVQYRLQVVRLDGTRAWAAIVVAR